MCRSLNAYTHAITVGLFPETRGSTTSNRADSGKPCRAEATTSFIFPSGRTNRVCAVHEALRVKRALRCPHHAPYDHTTPLPERTICAVTTHAYLSPSQEDKDIDRPHPYLFIFLSHSLFVSSRQARCDENPRFRDPHQALP